MTSNSRLFVGSLPYRFTEGQLLSLFAPFGRIVSLRIMHNRWGKSRGLGFVEFDNPDSAVKAKSALHNYYLEDRSIIVDFSKPDPLNTPEGQQRHREALGRKRVFRPKNRNIDRSSNPENQPRGKKFFNQPHLREGVFNSRFHGARVGRKFSQRTKKK